MRRLVVLGSSGGRPTAKEPCSGYLIEWDDMRIVLDLGYGTLPELLAYVPDGDVDAVVITHEHPDHCVDLHGLFRTRHYSYAGATRVPLYCPAGVLDRLAGLEPDVDLAEVFDHHPLPGKYALGGFELVGIPLPHFVPTVGVRLSNSDVVIAYATDTGPDPALADLGRNADLFVLDATDLPGETEQHERNLLAADEAGEWAHRAGARGLLLTHLWPGTDAELSADRAGRAFTGPIAVAVRGLVVDLDG